MKSPLKAIAILGIVLGGVFGMAGSFVGANLRPSFWAIDGVGLIVATAILALRYFRDQNDAVAVGFLVYSTGEAVMLSGTAASLEASVPAFAAGTALWSAALLLVSLPRHFALWTRAAGLIAAVLFAITSGSIFWGQPVNPLTHPLPFFAYPFLVLTFAGWVVALLKAS